MLNRCIQRALLGTILLAPAMITSCTVHAGYYDADHRDYHRWGPAEQPHFDAWIGETHHAPVKYEKLRDEDKRAYWNWRHDHP
jgi:hypothetical protein